MAMPHEEEFEEFLTKVNEVEATIKGLMAGEISAEQFHSTEQKICQVDQAAEKRRLRREKEKAEAEEKARQAEEERAAQERWKEENREQLEQLKRDYYLRKARRERWMEFRESNRSRAFSDYYKGWDLFEEDPDEDLFTGDRMAAVQDQAAFDAMAKDVDARTKERQGKRSAANKEKELGNLAFKAEQHSEAIAAYSRAIEFFKGDKAVFCNRALAHLRQRNFISALEDCNRAIEISKFLDEDFERRPPPPPLLKAYVRRSSANAELGHTELAISDLETAAGMAGGSSAELAEIRKLQKTLQQDVEAAAREEEAGREADGSEGGQGGREAQALRTRVRELLDDLPHKGGGEAEIKASKTLSELGALIRDSVGCRVALRQAGGVRQLLQLVGEGGDAEAKQAAATLILACLERKNQLEVHTCGGTTQILRELRRRVDTSGGVEGRDEARLAPQLRLLALACHHEKVREATKRLAVAEGGLERLVGLLSSPKSGEESTLAAATLLAVLTSGKGARESVVGMKASLVSALKGAVSSPSLDLSEQAATALGNLSVHSPLRAEMCNSGAVDALVALVKRPVVGGHVMLPNALAALLNCCTLSEGASRVVSVDMARALLPHLSSKGPLARRAAALLSKCATASKQVVGELTSDHAVGRLAALLVTEAAAMGGGGGGGEGKDDADLDAMEEKEEDDGVDGEMMVGALVRILAACAPQQEAAKAICEGGALPTLVLLLQRRSSGLQGNAALAIAECARDERCLAVLAVQPVVAPLLAIAHEGKGQAQKNAAIALGRLAKNQHCLKAIRENHGIEILARAMKDKLAH